MMGRPARPLEMVGVPEGCHWNWGKAAGGGAVAGRAMGRVAHAEPHTAMERTADLRISGTIAQASTWRRDHNIRRATVKRMDANSRGPPPVVFRQTRSLRLHHDCAERATPVFRGDAKPWKSHRHDAVPARDGVARALRPAA